MAFKGMQDLLSNFSYLIIIKKKKIMFFSRCVFLTEIHKEPGAPPVQNTLQDNRYGQRNCGCSWALLLEITMHLPELERYCFHSSFFWLNTELSYLPSQSRYDLSIWIVTHKSGNSAFYQSYYNVWTIFPPVLKRKNYQHVSRLWIVDAWLSMMTTEDRKGQVQLYVQPCYELPQQIRPKVHPIPLNTTSRDA